MISTVITGCRTGIGLELVKQLSRVDNTLVIATYRDITKAHVSIISFNCLYKIIFYIFEFNVWLVSTLIVICRCDVISPFNTLKVLWVLCSIGLHLRLNSPFSNCLTKCKSIHINPSYYQKSIFYHRYSTIYILQ